MNEHDWALFAAEAGVVLGARTDVTPGLGSTTVHFSGPVFSKEAVLDLPSVGFDDAEASLGLRLLAVALRRALQGGAPGVELLNLDNQGRGWRALYGPEHGGARAQAGAQVRAQIRAEVRSHETPDAWGTTLTVTHASRLGFSRRRMLRARLEGHCRQDGEVVLRGFQARSLGGFTGHLGADHVSWDRQHDDARLLSLGYAPGVAGSTALLFANDLLLEVVDLGGPQGTAVLIDRPWTREREDGEPLRRVCRDACLEGWRTWARAWAQRELASIRPKSSPG